MGPKPHMAVREIKAQGSQATREASELFIRTLERASLSLPSRDKVEDTGGPGYTWTGRFVRASQRGDGRTLGQADMGSWSYSYLAQTSIKSREQKPF